MYTPVRRLELPSSNACTAATPDRIKVCPAQGQATEKPPAPTLGCYHHPPGNRQKGVSINVPAVFLVLEDY